MKPSKDMTFLEMATELDILRGQSNKPTGPRAVYIVDRGWIFAGDAVELPSGDIRLERAIHVFRWESIGFAKMIDDWKSDKVDLRPVAPVELPKNSIIFKIPVDDKWGMRK